MRLEGHLFHHAPDVTSQEAEVVDLDAEVQRLRQLLSVFRELGEFSHGTSDNVFNLKFDMVERM